MAPLKLTVQSSRRSQMLEITRQLQELVTEQKLHAGLLIVYCPHTTSCFAQLSRETAGKSG